MSDISIFEEGWWVGGVYISGVDACHPTGKDLLTSSSSYASSTYLQEVKVKLLCYCQLRYHARLVGHSAIIFFDLTAMFSSSLQK